MICNVIFVSLLFFFLYLKAYVIEKRNLKKIWTKSSTLALAN